MECFPKKKKKQICQAPEIDIFEKNISYVKICDDYKKEWNNILQRLPEKMNSKHSTVITDWL